MYRGAVASAINGRRGQEFLKVMLAALEEMPDKRLTQASLKDEDGEFCALGVVGNKYGLDLDRLDSEEPEQVAKAFGIAPAMAKEIVFENDDDFGYFVETPEKRWRRMVSWVRSNIKERS